MVSMNYDHIIVGGGTAGCVLANRLSEDHDVNVLLLEAGQEQSTDNRVTTPMLWPALLSTEANWGLVTVPQPGLEGRKLVLHQGRLLGGSSAVNGVGFTGPSKANVDAWAELGNPGWGWDTMAQYYKKAYTLTKPEESVAKRLGLDYVDEDVRGTKGPIQISFPNEVSSVWPQAWLETFENMGCSISGDPFSGQYQGGFINAESVHPATKQRSFSANAYLSEEVRNRPNLNIMTGITVSKIVLTRHDNGEVQAQGVEYVKDGQAQTAHAQEVILSAGALNTPRLLELSGIGDAKLLQRHNIPVMLDNPNVGEHLQNHIMCGLTFETVPGMQTIDAIARRDPIAIQSAAEAYKHQKGPMATSSTYCSAHLPLPTINDSERTQLNAFLESSSATTTSFTSIHQSFVRSCQTSKTDASAVYISIPGFAAFESDGSMGPHPQSEETYFTIAAGLAHPMSLGSTHICSADPSLPSTLDPRYLSHPADLEILAHHVRNIERIAHTEPLASFLKPDGKRNPGAPQDCVNLDVCRDYVRKTAVGQYHAIGTCAMMPRGMGGVVDHYLRVHGVRGLRVCDASVVPITPKSTPQATVYAVAERGADLIKESRTCG